MDHNKHQNSNRLTFYRHRMRFTQTHVARLLGLRSTTMLSRYENARCIPPLTMAFRLGIVLRVPIEFLFPGIYDGLRHDIRAQGEKMAPPGQQALFQTELTSTNS